MSEAARILIEARANINAQDYGGETPILKAAVMKHTAAFSALLENGADRDGIMVTQSSEQTAPSHAGEVSAEIHSRGALPVIPEVESSGSKS